MLIYVSIGIAIFKTFICIIKAQNALNFSG